MSTHLFMTPTAASAMRGASAFLVLTHSLQPTAYSLT